MERKIQWGKKISKIQKAYGPLLREIFQPFHNPWLLSIVLGVVN